MLLSLVLMTQAFGQSVSSFTVGTTQLLGVGNLSPSWSGTPTTVGSPGVFRHDITGLLGFIYPDVLFMAYETQIADATAGCPSGQWGVGLAYSTNGTTWTDYGPVVEPGSDYYTCVAAHPTVVPLTSSSWLLYFKAEQDPATCTPTPTLSCDRYVGLGRVVITHAPTGFFSVADFYNYTISAPDDAPVLKDVAQDMGYPSVVFAAGQYRMVFAQNPDLFTTSSSFTTSFSTPTAVAIPADSSAVGWDRDELYSPSLTCEAGTPYKIFTGGRIYDPYPILTDASVGRYTSTNFTTWTESLGPYFRTSLSHPEMRHIDVQTSGTRSQYGIYFAKPTGSGNAIFLARTSGFNVGLDSKRCP